MTKGVIVEMHSLNSIIVVYSVVIQEACHPFDGPLWSHPNAYCLTECRPSGVKPTDASKMLTPM